MPDLDYIGLNRDPNSTLHFARLCFAQCCASIQALIIPNLVNLERGAGVLIKFHHYVRIEKLRLSSWGCGKSTLRIAFVMNALKTALRKFRDGGRENDICLSFCLRDRFA